LSASPMSTNLPMTRALPRAIPRHNTLRGGLGLFSTCADYGKFATMLLNGRGPDGECLISPAMHRLMLANRIPRSQMPLSLGPVVFPGYGHCLIGWRDAGPGPGDEPHRSGRGPLGGGRQPEPTSGSIRPAGWWGW
jgi:CubicO group peptidase (beta-lactamase class C family)